jgi:atypical PilZ domain-containing cyclic di-GMP receptor
MPDSFLGDGLTFEELLPLSWVEGPLPQGLELARLNADNHQLLGAEASLEEVRVGESLSKEESPALVHELQRLEYKLNVLLRLMADLVARSSAIPAAQPTRLGARGLEWTGAAAPRARATGLVYLYINPALPQPLKIPCEVSGERTQGGQHVAQLEFRDLSEAVKALLEKLIFRHHRRLIAGARVAGG